MTVQLLSISLEKVISWRALFPNRTASFQMGLGYQGITERLSSRRRNPSSTIVCFLVYDDMIIRKDSGRIPLGWTELDSRKNGMQQRIFPFHSGGPFRFTGKERSHLTNDSPSSRYSFTESSLLTPLDSSTIVRRYSSARDTRLGSNRIRVFQPK